VEQNLPNKTSNQPDFHGIIYKVDLLVLSKTIAANLMQHFLLKMFIKNVHPWSQSSYAVASTQGNLL